ncbi:MAG: alkaline phosphatase family protein [Thermoproteota archaeon]
MDVIIFLLDGCRTDALSMASAPNILSMMEKGFFAKRCRTVYPSLTGPCHISILTGAYPERTGIVGHFYWEKDAMRLHDIFSDKYCIVKTIFEVLAENYMKGVSIGSYMRRGSFDRLSRRATKSIASWFSGRRSIMNFIDRNPRVYKFLRGFVVGRYSEFERAFESGEYNLYYLAFNEVDKAGHKYGPESQEYYRAIEECDGKIGKAVKMAEEMGREFLAVVTSDHGQIKIEEKLSLDTLSLDEVGYRLDEEIDISGAKILKYNSGKENMAVGAIVSRHVQIWLSKPDDAPMIAKHLSGRRGIEHLRLREESKRDFLKHERVGDISFCLSSNYGFDFLPMCERGDHGGFEPAEMEVPLIFYSNGIRRSQIPEASTVDIAPTLLQNLGISPPEYMQGRILI